MLAHLVKDTREEKSAKSETDPVEWLEFLIAPKQRGHFALKGTPWATQIMIMHLSCRARTGPVPVWAT